MGDIKATRDEIDEAHEQIFAAFEEDSHRKDVEHYTFKYSGSVKKLRKKHHSDAAITCDRVKIAKLDRDIVKST